MNSGEERHLQDPAIPNNSWEVLEQTCVSMRNHQKCLWLQREQQDISSFGEETQMRMCQEIQVRGFPGNLQGSHRHPVGLEQVLLFSKEAEEWTQLIPTPKAGFFF